MASSDAASPTCNPPIHPWNKTNARLGEQSTAGTRYSGRTCVRERAREVILEEGVNEERTHGEDEVPVDEGRPAAVRAGGEGRRRRAHLPHHLRLAGRHRSILSSPPRARTGSRSGNRRFAVGLGTGTLGGGGGEIERTRTRVSSTCCFGFSNSSYIGIQPSGSGEEKRCAVPRKKKVEEERAGIAGAPRRFRNGAKKKFAPEIEIEIEATHRGCIGLAPSMPPGPSYLLQRGTTSQPLARIWVCRKKKRTR